MIFKRLTFISLLLLSSLAGNSQVFEWIRTAPVGYSLNPSYPECPVHFDRVNQRVVHARIDTVTLIYGSYTLGSTFLESRDTAGQVQWQFQLGNFAIIQRIVTDQAGNIYVGGLFQQTLSIGSNDSLEFIIAPFVFQNTFIIKLDIQGNLIWKRNVTNTWSQYEGIEAMAVDQNGNCWYAMTDFFIAKIVEMDGSGTDQVIHTIENGKRIGNFSFDPWGGMYVSGAAEHGNFIMDADTFVAASDYNMFIARFDAAGQPGWAYFGHDITFQKPMVIADGFGNAFMAGNRFDTTSFNGVLFTDPYLSNDFFAFKIDTSGTISWDLQQPPLGIGPFGNFETGSNLVVDADAAGNFYLGGIQRNTVDWGGNFISSTPNFNDRLITITCVNPSGIVQWVKMGGGIYTNTMHALSVSDAGACYFTGSFRNAAEFDSIIFANSIDYNFVLGKINPAIPSGIHEYGDEQLIIYPNPSSVEINLPDEMLNSMLQIFDVAGKLIYQDLKVGVQKINIREFKQGVYTLVVQNEQSIFHSKFVIKHY